MVKDTFLIGLLVVEGAARAVKSEKLKPTKPIWPPRKTTAGATAALSRQQLTELAKVARSLALACVMDQVIVYLPLKIVFRETWSWQGIISRKH